MAVEDLIFRMRADTRDAVAGFDKVGKSAKANLGGVEKQVGKAQSAFASMGKAVAGAAVAGAVIGFGRSAIYAAEAASTARSRIEQIAVSMGRTREAAGTLTDRLVKLADKTALQTGISQTAIKESQALLLTFKSLAGTADTVGGAFDRATQASLDLQAAGFGSAAENAKRLGKALEDPILGMTALRESGITFTKDQQNVIKSMVATGKVAEAQNLLLEAVESQVGGTAKATANATDKISVAFSQVAEQIGQALLPALEAVMPALTSFADAMRDAAPVLRVAGKAAGATAGGITALITPWQKADAGDRLVAGLLSVGGSEVVRGVVSLGKALFGAGDGVDWLTAKVQQAPQPVAALVDAHLQLQRGVLASSQAQRDAVTAALDLRTELRAAEQANVGLAVSFGQVATDAGAVARSLGVGSANYQAVKDWTAVLFGIPRQIYTNISVNTPSAKVIEVNRRLRAEAERNRGAAVGLGEIPGYDNGGVVPGRRGSPQLVMAHGGETILPTHKGSASAGGNVYNITIHAVDGRDVVEKIRQFERVNGKGWRS